MNRIPSRRSRGYRAWLLLIVSLGLASAAPAPPVPGPRTVLTGSIAPVPSAAALRAADLNRRIEFMIPLKMRNYAEMLKVLSSRVRLPIGGQLVNQPRLRPNQDRPEPPRRFCLRNGAPTAALHAVEIRQSVRGKQSLCFSANGSERSGRVGAAHARHKWTSALH